MRFLPKSKMLSYEEMLRLCHILGANGVRKVRITGGEPFARRNIDYFLTELSKTPGIEDLYITTNGVLTPQYIPLLQKLKFKGVNLSLDTLSRENFKHITKRDEFPAVMEAFSALLESGIAIKVNMVVMDGFNNDEILPMAELAVKHDVSVRFIEEMPFNGTDRSTATSPWKWTRILEELKSGFPNLTEVKTHRNSTSKEYYSAHMKGRVGIIPAFSRTFCGTCNRIRITASGLLKTCLYDNGVLNLKELLVSGKSDDELLKTILGAFSSRAKDGFEAESRRDTTNIEESMSTIGG